MGILRNIALRWRILWATIANKLAGYAGYRRRTGESTPHLIFRSVGKIFSDRFGRVPSVLILIAVILLLIGGALNLGWLVVTSGLVLTWLIAISLAGALIFAVPVLWFFGIRPAGQQAFLFWLSGLIGTICTTLYLFLLPQVGLRVFTVVMLSGLAILLGGVGRVVTGRTPASVLVAIATVLFVGSNLYVFASPVSLQGLRAYADGHSPQRIALPDGTMKKCRPEGVTDWIEFVYDCDGATPPYPAVDGLGRPGRPLRPSEALEFRKYVETKGAKKKGKKKAPRSISHSSLIRFINLTGGTQSVTLVANEKIRVISCVGTNFNWQRISGSFTAHASGKGVKVELSEVLDATLLKQFKETAYELIIEAGPHGARLDMTIDCS